MGLLAFLLSLMGCDGQRIAELEEGVSTEADVTARFGVPDKTWAESDGGRTLEYSRQPAGHRNYMITIGPDGRMTALRQVLTPANFARVQPGMAIEDVLRRLGRPMKVSPWPLKKETGYDWRFLDDNNTSQIFTVYVDTSGEVRRTGITPDPETAEQRR